MGGRSSVRATFAQVRAADQHLVEHHPDGVDVGGRTDEFVAGLFLFGGHVAGVPSTAPVRVSSASAAINFARPKSVTRGRAPGSSGLAQTARPPASRYFAV